MLLEVVGVVCVVALVIALAVTRAGTKVDEQQGLPGEDWL